MIKKITALVVFIFISSPLSWATPPQTLDLSYNPSAGMLKVSGNHPTQDRLEHFIRRVVITRQYNEPETFYLTRQNSANEFEITVPVKFQPGETVRIDVYCSQGGTKSAELQVPKIVQNTKALEVSPEDLKALKDQEHKNSPIIP